MQHASEHSAFQEPAVVFEEVDWAMSDPSLDTCCSIVEQFAEARAVRMVSVGKPILVQHLRRQRSIARSERLSMKRPVTPRQTPERTHGRAPSHDTLDSHLSTDRKTLDSADPRTPALSHDDECSSPLSENSPGMPPTPSMHSLEKHGDVNEVDKAEENQQSGSSSALSQDRLDCLQSALASADPNSFKSRMGLSRLRLFARRSSAALSHIECTASEPSSPVSPSPSPSSRLSLATIRTKLVARGASDRESTADLVADLASWDDETPKASRLEWIESEKVVAVAAAKPSSKRQRIRRIESRLGLNERQHSS